MEILRLIAVHFGVAVVMSLGFVVAPLAKRAVVAAADRILQRRRKRSERWLLDVRTLDDILAKRLTCRSHDPLHRNPRAARLR